MQILSTVVSSRADGIVTSVFLLWQQNFTTIARQGMTCRASGLFRSTNSVWGEEPIEQPLPVVSRYKCNYSAQISCDFWQKATSTEDKFLKGRTLQDISLFPHKLWRQSSPVMSNVIGTLLSLCYFFPARLSTNKRNQGKTEFVFRFMFFSSWAQTAHTKMFPAFFKLYPLPLKPLETSTRSQCRGRAPQPSIT